MSQVQTKQMGRLTAAGTLDKLDDALSLLAQLKALHFVDYDGSMAVSYTHLTLPTTLTV